MAPVVGYDISFIQNTAVDDINVSVGGKKVTLKPGAAFEIECASGIVDVS